MRLWPLALLLLLLVLLAGCSGEESGLAAEQPPATTMESSVGLRAVELARELDRPIYVTATAAEPDRLYVVEQAGVVRVMRGGVVEDEPFLDIRKLVLTSPRGESVSEQGLLSLAFAPDYATNGRFYVDYTDRRGRVTVAVYRAREGRADPTSARRLLVVEKKKDGHNGGQLQFGLDGRLYVGIGDDEASQVHPQSLAPGNVLGKIVALDLDDPAARWEVVGYGLRNPWRFSFDRESGDLWIGDVGELSWEEVNLVRRSDSGLWNFGWDGFEGYERIEWDEGGHNEPHGPGELVWPIAVYSHEAGCAVTGGYVYRGKEVEGARGRYFYGDFCTGAVWSLSPERPEEVRLELDLSTTLASFGEDAAGELYLVSRTGRIYRLSD